MLILQPKDDVLCPVPAQGLSGEHPVNGDVQDILLHGHVQGLKVWEHRFYSPGVPGYRNGFRG
jgi:hypothetical protein